jgi:hypothetical protein
MRARLPDGVGCGGGAWPYVCTPPGPACASTPAGRNFERACPDVAIGAAGPATCKVAMRAGARC